MSRWVPALLLFLPALALGLGPLVYPGTGEISWNAWERRFNLFFWGAHPAPGDPLAALFGLSQERFDRLVRAAVEDASRCAEKGAGVFVSLDGTSTLPGDTRVRHLWENLGAALTEQRFSVAASLADRADYRLDWDLTGEPAAEARYRVILKVDLIKPRGVAPPCSGRAEQLLGPVGV